MVLPEPAKFSPSQLESLDTLGSVGFESCMTCGIRGGTKIRYEDGAIEAINIPESLLNGDESVENTSINRPKLLPCIKCSRVMYCSTKCAEEDPYHTNVCEHLQTMSKQEKVSDVKSELDAILHRRLITDCKDDRKNEQTDKKKSLEIEDFFAHRFVDDIHLQHILSFPLTVAHALWKHPEILLDRHSLRNNKLIENRRSLIVHIVGASGEETQHLEAWRELYYLTVNQEKNKKGLYSRHEHKVISHTKLYFIGPEVYTLHNAQKVRNQKFIGGHLEMHIIKERYHKAIQMRTLSLPIPDVIILFQPDLSHPDYKWNKSLVEMMKFGRPILITSGTNSELVRDIKKLIREKFGGRVYTTPERNIYESPWIYQSETVANDIFKKNAYYSIIVPRNLIANK